jgi:NUMOD4 motif/HNH endonuclease
MGWSVGFDPRTEIWLPVVGFETYYEVSDAGRVRSLDRWHPGRGGKGQVPRRGRILKQTPHRATGYLCVCLGVDGRKIQRRVHRLVCEAFHGPRPPGKEVLHGPGGQLDNSAANLHWGTHSENLLDTRRDGTTAGFRPGDAHPFGKLSMAIARECRRRYGDGETAKALAVAYDVDLSCMAALIRGETWPDPEYVPPPKYGHKRLTDADVRTIRQSSERAADLAAAFGVHESTVRSVRRGASRANVA